MATRAVSAGTAKSHISVLLTGLEERGWLRRENDPSDARAKRLYLEPAGERMAERTAAVQARVVAAMTEGAPADDLSFVQRVMTVVSTRLQAELAAGP